MKFAKKISSGSGQLKRMFHLLTSKSASGKIQLITKNNSHKVGKADLTEKHFKLEYD